MGNDVSVRPSEAAGDVGGWLYATLKRPAAPSLCDRRRVCRWNREEAGGSLRWRAGLDLANRGRHKVETMIVDCGRHGNGTHMKGRRDDCGMLQEQRRARDSGEKRTT